MNNNSSLSVAPTHGWSFVQLAGKDVVKFLNNFCTADLKRLQPGQAQELMLLNAKGHVLSWGSALADDHGMVLMLTGQSADETIKHLDAYLFSEDVQLSRGNVRAWLITATIQSEKPRRSELLVPRRGKLCDGLVSGEFPKTTISSSQWCVWRASHDAWWLITSDALELSEIVTESASWRSAFPGRTVCLPTSIMDYHQWRIAASVPVIGQDSIGNTLPQELLRDDLAISFTKGCYLGQETVARLDAMGHVNWNLRTVTLDSLWPEELKDCESTAPINHVTIRNPEQSLGQMTSVCGDRALVRIRAAAVEDFNNKGGLDWQLCLNDSLMPHRIVQIF
ncbi:MAG: hypothetical protein JNL67_15840 [Planctomycetaceae bacterium]|nr:hypothetical protein [Planctomycetaceae bacterium]